MDIVSARLVLKFCHKEWPGQVSIVVMLSCSDHGVTRRLTPWGGHSSTLKLEDFEELHSLFSLFPGLTGRLTVETTDFSN